MKYPPPCLGPLARSLVSPSSLSPLFTAIPAFSRLCSRSLRLRRSKISAAAPRSLASVSHPALFSHRSPRDHDGDPPPQSPNPCTRCPLLRQRRPTSHLCLTRCSLLPLRNLAAVISHPIICPLATLSRRRSLAHIAIAMDVYIARALLDSDGITAEKRLSSLKEQLAVITPLLEDLKMKKEERVQQFAGIRSQIEKITAEITENGHSSIVAFDEQDLSTRKLNEYQTQLRALQKEKSDRLQNVLKYTNEVHSLCGVLGLDFRKVVAEVHPSLCDTSSGKSTNISTKTLDGLFQAIAKLKEERKSRAYKLRETLKSLLELWKLMDSSENEKHHFEKVARILDSPYGEITEPSLLSLDIIKQIETEVERLTKLKASRMKELVLKRRLELEEVCRRIHIEPDMSTAPEKTTALIDSGLVDPTELIANIEAQIKMVREESIGRKEILDRIDRWFAAREEENWLEEYNQDENRYSAGKGAHLNLKRAEKARVTVSKISAILDNLILKTFAWEDRKNMPFLYDGVRLISILEEYKLTRLQREAAKRQYRERKKLHALLEKESVYGSKPSSRSSSFNSKANGRYMDGSRFGTQTPQKLTVGCATPGLQSPRSYSGHNNRYSRHIRRLSSTNLNFTNLPREDTSSSFASKSGSDPEPSSLG